MLCVQNNNFFDVKMTVFPFAYFQTRPKRCTINWFWRGRTKIITHLHHCHCSEGDKALSYIFYILSHKVIAYSCIKTLPIRMCVGETGTCCESWEKINQTGQKPLVIMTHGNGIWSVVVQNNMQFRKMLLPSGHHPTCELFWNQKLFQTSLWLKNTLITENLD